MRSCPRRVRAALLAVSALALAPGHAAAAPVTTGPIDGDVVALALAGDATVLVRQPDRGQARVEVRRAGAPVRVLATFPASSEGVSLAAGPEAIAVSWVGRRTGDDYDEDIGARTQVLVGPLSGPLRPVAGCAAGFVPQAVAVDGSQVAWVDGGCAGPGRQRYEVGPSAIVRGDVDPAVPTSRLDLPADTLAGGLALNGADGVVSILRPTFFFSSTTDVQRFGPDGLEPKATRLSSAFAVPLGLRPDGTPALLQFANYDEEPLEDQLCPDVVGLLPTGATGIQSVGLGGCVAGDEYSDDDSLPLPAAFAADRVTALVTEVDEDDLATDDEYYYERTANLVTRTPAGGGTPEVLARTDFRGLSGVAADATRAAWTQVRCRGGAELVTTDVPVGTQPRCTTRVGHRAAKVRGRAITLKITCARGCSGELGDDSRCYGSGRGLGSFAFGPGTHRVRVRVRRETARSGRLLLAVAERGGKRYNRVVRFKATRAS